MIKLVQRSVFFLAFLLINSSLKALDYFWIGGSGSWSDLTHWVTSSGGTTLHTTIPGTSDNVYFDANSGSGSIALTINVNTIYAKDLIFLPGVPAVSFSQNHYEFDLFGSLQLQPNVTLFLSDMVYWNFSGSGLHTIRSNGVPISRIRLKGTGTYSLHDSLWVNTDFTLENGGFQSNGHKISCHTFFARDIANSPIKSFNSSIIRVYRNGWHSSFELQGGGNFQFVGSRLTLQGQHSRLSIQTSDSVRIQQVTMSGESSNELHSSGSTRINKLNINGVNQLVNFRKIDTISYGPSTYIALNESANPLTINVLQGPSGPCDGGIHIQGRQTTQCSLSLPGPITLQNASFRNIQVVNGSINAVNGKDYGNNSGISFTSTPSTTYYWVNGSGNWNDMTHWSTSSGGPPASCLPRAHDHVVFDQNSGTGSVNVNLPRMTRVHNVTSATNFPISLNGPSYLFVGGSLRTNSFATINFDDTWYPSGIIHFSTSPTSLDSLSVRTEIEGNLYVLGSGSLEFGDSTKVRGEFRVLSGTSNLSNRYLSSGYFADQWAPFSYYSIDSGYINLNNTEVRINSGYNFDNSKLFWDETGSVIKIYSNDGWGYTWATNKAFWELQMPVKANKFNMNGNGFRARKLVNMGTIDLYQYNLHDWDTLSLGADSRIVFQHPGNVNIDTIIAATSCTAFASILSTTDTTRFNLQTGPIQTEYLTLQNIKNNSSSVSWTSLSSNDLGGNSNISFTQGAPRTLYWVGGSGSWADSTHWSLLSSGPGGECLPTPVDSVIFDPASFMSSSDTVFISSTRAYSKDLVVSYTGDLRFEFDQQGVLNPYGSVTFQQSTYPVSQSHGASIEFSGADSTYFKTNNSLIHVILKVRKTGSVTLIDSLKCTWGDRGLDVYRGGFYSNQSSIYSDHVYLIPDGPNDSAYVDLSGSNIEVIGDWNCFIARGSLSYRGDSSKIYATSDRARVEVRDSVELRHLEFTNSSNSPHTVLTSSNGGRINYLQLQGNLNFNGPSLIDTLLLKPDYTYLFDPNHPHIVYDSLRARGDFCHFIGIKSQIPSQQATIRTFTPVSGDFLEIRDMNYAGNFQFYTGANSTNQGNNNGFIWANQPGYIYGFPDDTVHLFCHGPNIADSIELRTDNFNDAVGFVWNTGDTTSSLWVSQSGTYWVGADYVSCVVYDTINVQLNYLLPIATAQKAVCKGSNIALSANGSNPQFNYVWSNGDTSALTSYVVNRDTTIHVQIYRGGFLFCSDSITIRSSAIDSLTLLSTNPFCHGDSTGQISLQQIHGGFGPFQYSWSHMPSLQSSIATNLPQGCYSVTVFDSLGCSTSDTICLSQPQPLSASISMNPPVCTYDYGSIVFNPSGGAGNYQISYINFNPGQMLPGTYSVQVLDSNGCTLDTTFVLPVAQVIDYQIILDTATCLQSNGAVTVQATNPNSPYEYFWSALPFFSGASLINQAPGATGFVVVIDTLTNCMDTAFYTIPFGGITNAFFGVSQNQGPTPLVVQTNNANTASQLINYWIINGDTVSNAIDTTFIFTQYGTYLLQHCLWDPQFNCVKCYELTITAEPNPALEVPNVFSPNGDGINDYFTPAEVRDLDLIEIQIHSRNGQLIWQSNQYPFNWDGRSQIGGLSPAGVYYWTLRYREALSESDIYLNGTVTLVR